MVLFVDIPAGFPGEELVPDCTLSRGWAARLDADPFFTQHARADLRDGLSDPCRIQTVTSGWRSSGINSYPKNAKQITK